MSFWKVFKEKSAPGTKSSDLQQSLAQLFPQTNDEELIKIACISGLMTRVAYADGEIHENEKKSILDALAQWSEFNTEECEKITQLAFEKVQDFAGLQDHLYAHHIIELTSNEERFNILKILFHLAAADENVDSEETEIVRQITSSLRLEHQHFIAARATVAKHLGALKK